MYATVSFHKAFQHVEGRILITDADYPSNGQPIAGGTWNPSVDAASQNNWAISVGSALNKKAIIQAGNSNDSPPKWGAAELIATQNATVKQYIHDYAHHNYPGGTVTSLMSHSGISRNLHVFDADVAATLKEGKQYVFGETNSGMCPAFHHLYHIITGSSTELTDNVVKSREAVRHLSHPPLEQRCGRWTTCSERHTAISHVPISITER